jgi:DNA invertase Pin-like site-specific DNA recombinase
MANYIYNRASTDSQDFMQQQNCINGYLRTRGIDPLKDVAKTVVEKVSGTVNHTERKLSQLIAKCKSGDTIFISELSRLGRNMSDLFAIVTECCSRGITIVQCKDGSTIENESIGGKSLLFALSLAAEIEVANTRQRTQMALDARKQILADRGSFISKSGKVCTKLGRPKGYKGDNSAAVIAKQDMAIAWRENSMAVKFALRKRAEGWTLQRIVDEIGQLYDDNAPSDPSTPNPYATPNGCKPLRGTVSKWLREANPLTLAV